MLKAIASMINLNSHYLPNPEVVSTTLDTGETVLINLTTANYFSLNETGTRIWTLLGEGQSVAEVAAILTAEYAVTAPQAQQSVLALIDALAAHELVTA